MKGKHVDVVMSELEREEVVVFVTAESQSQPQP